MPHRPKAHHRSVGTLRSTIAPTMAPLLVEHDFEELAELHNRIELGPHWDTIEKIEVFRVNHITATALTVEQSKRL